jgi:hypothetical protein
MAVSLAVALALNALASDFFIDDAYISFHYADNLVRDGSLYYNRGEQGPFGYTNPLYVFLLAAVRWISAGTIPYEAIARGLGVLSLTALLTAVLWAIAVRTAPHGRSATLAACGVAVLFVLLFPELLPNFFSGLETGLFTLCLFAMVLNLKADTRRSEIGFLAALAGALSLRMDGGFLVLPLLAVYGLEALRQGDPRRLLRLGYGVLAAGAVYLVQLAVAGFWLPLSLAQKKSAFSFQTAGSYEGYALLVTAPLIVLTYRRIPRRLTGLAVLYPLFVSLFYGFFMHWMFKRYVFPAAFTLAMALLLSFLQLDLRRHRREAVLLILYAFIAFPAGLLEGYSWISGYRVAMLTTHRIAEAMNAAELPAEHRTFAAQDAGYFAYRTDWRLLDLLGLTTPEIFREDVAGAVRRLSPTVLILNAPNTRRPEELKLVSRLGRPDSPLPAGYRFVRHLPFTNKYWWPEMDYGYFIFVSPDANPELVAGLAGISIDVDREIGRQRYGLRLLRAFAAIGR